MGLVYKVFMLSLTLGFLVDDGERRLSEGARVEITSAETLVHCSMLLWLRQRWNFHCSMSGLCRVEFPPQLFNSLESCGKFP